MILEVSRNVMPRALDISLWHFKSCWNHRSKKCFALLPKRSIVPPMPKKKPMLLIPAHRIEKSILLIRDQKVMLDRDLAELYGVETRVLVQAVKRNLKRFPNDFMFQLTKKEFDNLRSQFVISSSWGGRRTPPYAFTEQGVAMLSSVLKSDRAIDVNVEIMRTFVRLREMLASHKDLARKLAALEKKYGEHDEKINAIFDRHQTVDDPTREEERSYWVSDRSGSREFGQMICNEASHHCQRRRSTLDFRIPGLCARATR